MRASNSSEWWWEETCLWLELDSSLTMWVVFMQFGGTGAYGSIHCLGTVPRTALFGLASKIRRDYYDYAVYLSQEYFGSLVDSSNA